MCDNTEKLLSVDICGQKIDIYNLSFDEKEDDLLHIDYNYEGDVDKEIINKGLETFINDVLKESIKE